MVLEGIAERSSLEYVINSYIDNWTERYRTRVPNEAILADPEQPSSPSNRQTDREVESQRLRSSVDNEIVEEEYELPSQPYYDDSMQGPTVRDGQEVAVEEVGDEGWQDVMLVDAMNESDTAVLMDFSPSQIPDTTPLNKVFHLFVMLGLSFTFVTRYGAVVGVITKRDLIKREL